MTAAAARAAEGPRLPRPLLWIGVPVAAVLLTALFVFLGFPYDRVRDGVAANLGRATGSQVQIAELGPGLSPLGPGVVARGITARLPDGQTWKITRLKLRPAWSLAWLGGTAAVAMDLEAPEGRLGGTLYAGDEPGFDGELAGVQLGRLPLDGLLAGIALDGQASGDVDLRSTAAGPRGRVDLEAEGGSLGLPGLPVALPYQSLEAELALRDDGTRIERISLDGPMLSGEAEGSLAAGPLPRARLDLRVKLAVREPSLQPMIQSMGVRLAGDGTADVRVTGTLSRPEVRPAR